jgi:copper chaperone CopZ
MNSRDLYITGMTCNSCATDVEKALLAVPGFTRRRCPAPTPWLA